MQTQLCRSKTPSHYLPGMYFFISTFLGAGDGFATNSSPDAMLELIPTAALESAAAEKSSALNETKENENGESSLQQLRFVAFTLSQQNRRDDLAVPLPGEGAPSLSLTGRLNLRGSCSPDSHSFSDETNPSTAHSPLSFHWDIRLEAAMDDETSFEARDDLHLFVKEAYFTYALPKKADHDSTILLDVGRINPRFGVAYGFNPTDFYKDYAALSYNSIDQSGQRNERLGIVGLRAGRFSQGKSLSLFIAPDLVDPESGSGSLLEDAEIIGLGLERTNKRLRSTLSLSKQYESGLFAEGLLHLEGSELDEPALGFNLSYALFDNLLIHSESSLAYRYSLLGKTYPSLADEADKAWFFQEAAGLTWSSRHNVTTSFEIHYNGAGMDDDEWKRWFAEGRSATALTAQSVRGRLWSTRGLARDLQEPLSRRQLFLRTSWVDALDNVDLNILTFLNPQDGSLMTQLEGVYAYNEKLMFTARLIKNTGDADSEHGSMQNDTTVMGVVSYCF